MHELVDLTTSTEEQLRRGYVQVGDHLYLSSNEKLSLRRVSAEDAKQFQVVLAMAGKGVRLLHATRGAMSKHMIRIVGQPLSKYTFDLWRDGGFLDFCFLIDDSSKGKSISRFYGRGKRFGTKNRYSIEHDQLGTGGAVRKAIVSHTIEKPFIMHYPDDQVVNYQNFPQDFLAVFEAAMQRGYLVVVVCVPGTIYPWGEVCDENGKVADFVEKPFIRKDSYTGICGISSSLFPLINGIDMMEGAVKIERILFPTLARRGKMFKVILPYEFWIPVNDEPTLRRFEQVVLQRGAGPVKGSG